MKTLQEKARYIKKYYQDKNAEIEKSWIVDNQLNYSNFQNTKKQWKENDQIIMTVNILTEKRYSDELLNSIFPTQCQKLEEIYASISTTN
jgi:hypothetical protein